MNRETMSQQQQLRSVKVDAVPRLQLFNCVHADCGATFTRRWRLEEHETAHSGEVTSARVFQCACSRARSRQQRLPGPAGTQTAARGNLLLKDQDADVAVNAPCARASNS